ncbi:hypothetical protein SAMN05421736_1592 [Evansella caseinilytica]|uniref:Uncharacterized protein n=1 Tax=Evansella caseinilytica TaxID=1503961 RepID=A0A1H3V5E4_9BACI|nr:hypothetical protein [Evansella caseinilytica]SDZ69269.1 hypothetical protein SAMN05421736_1592 [Evansella caseinilytica]
MDYELFIYSTETSDYIADLLMKEAKNIVESELKLKVEEEHNIYIGCGYFSMNIEIEDISDLEFINKNYNLNINMCISIQVYHKTFALGISQLLKVLGKVLSEIKGDALLIFNGSTQVLKREKGILYVNENADLSKYPLRELGLSYVKAELN